MISDTPVITAESGLTAEEQAYDQFIIEHHTKFNHYMDDLGALFVEAGEDERLLHSDDWHLSVEQNLEFMLVEAEEIAGYENVPERFVDVHYWMMKLAPNTRLLSANILIAIEDNDLDEPDAMELFDHLTNILTFVLNANEERSELIPFGLAP
jgi:hypothetical protein